MLYREILSDAVVSSEWTYAQISEKCRLKGVSVSRSYLSKLCTGHMTPASDEVNNVLSQVLSDDPEVFYRELSVAKYRQLVPKDVLEAMASRH